MLRSVEFSRTAGDGVNFAIRVPHCPSGVESRSRSTNAAARICSNERGKLQRAAIRLSADRSIALYYVLIQRASPDFSTVIYNYYNTRRMMDLPDRKPWQHPVLKRLAFEGAPTGRGGKKKHLKGKCVRYRSYGDGRRKSF